MKIYLDVSCLNRPFDDQTQPRIHFESAAIALIFDRFDAGLWEQLASRMSQIEVLAISDPIRRNRVLQLLPERIMELTPEMFSRARAVVALGMSAADAVHLSAAEILGVDAMLTCDDRFLRRATRLAKKIKVPVVNPVDWIKEYIDATKS
jgi:hypothetical protein